MQRSTLILGILILATIPAEIRADGCILNKLGEYVRETEQQAYIEWDDGHERLFVATRAAHSNGPTVWLVPIPATPFPNVNDRAAIKKIIAKLIRGAYAVIAVGVILLAALVYGAIRLL